MHDNIDEVTAQKILRYAKLTTKNTSLRLRHLDSWILGEELLEIDKLLAEIGLPHEKIRELAAQNLQKSDC